MKNNLDMSLLGIGNQVPCFFTIFHSLHGSKLILSELKNVYGTKSYCIKIYKINYRLSLTLENFCVLTNHWKTIKVL